VNRNLQPDEPTIQSDARQSLIDAKGGIPTTPLPEGLSKPENLEVEARLELELARLEEEIKRLKGELKLLKQERLIIQREIEGGMERMTKTIQMLYIGMIWMINQVNEIGKRIIFYIIDEIYKKKILRVKKHLKDNIERKQVKEKQSRYNDAIIVSSDGICDNSSERMERNLPNQNDKLLKPLTPLQEHATKLGEYLDNNPTPDLKKLDEYFIVATQALKEEANREEKQQEELRETAQYFEKLSNGTDQEKWEYCIAAKEDYIKDVDQYKILGNKELEVQSQMKANNWQNLATALQEKSGFVTRLNIQSQQLGKSRVRKRLVNHFKRKLGEISAENKK